MNAQATQALTLANEIRLAGCYWRRDVRSQPPAEGRATLAATLERGDFPREIGTLHLRRFLTSANRLGDKKASEICFEASILRRDPRVRDLTHRERFALAAALRRRAEGAR